MEKFLLFQVCLRGEKFNFATSLRCVQLCNLQCVFGKSDCLKKVQHVEVCVLWVPNKCPPNRYFMSEVRSFL